MNITRKMNIITTFPILFLFLLYKNIKNANDKISIIIKYSSLYLDHVPTKFVNIQLLIIVIKNKAKNKIKSVY